MDREQKPLPCQQTPNRLNRRQFLKSSAFLGGSALLMSQLEWAHSLLKKAESGTLTTNEQYQLAKAENIIYSVCLQCHTDCPIKGKLLNGVLVKIDGPAYSPQGMLPQVKYATSPVKAAPIDGKVCPKGQAGIQSLYDPYRLVKVLKRTGPRGSNQWKTIPFDQAIREIVNGGYLFKDVAGEEKRYVPGLKEIYKIRDPKIMQLLAADAKKVAKKEMTLAEFRNKHRASLKMLIDPAHPDLGPINNQFVFLAGRIEHGRKEFAKRWLIDAFGSVNWYEHTTICEQSHHIAYAMSSNQYAKGKWSGGKHHMKPDALNSKYIIFFGTGAFEANFGPPPMAEKITEGIVTGRLKIAVVDPRFSKTAAKAHKWVPIQPGTDGAFALGMIRWIIQNKKYDARFLTNANKAAAVADGEPSWSTATWLVKIQDDGTPGAYLRAADLGRGDNDTFVVMKQGQPAVVNPYDTKNAVEGDLQVDTTINGIRVKSAFQLLWESAASRSLADWAKICGVKPETIIELAREFTSHGKQAVAEFYRGPVQHTNGYYNGQALVSLNLLVGNPDWKGGLSAGGGHWHEFGGKPGNPFDLKKMHPGKLGSFGIKLSREKSKYEETTLFKGYPAKRPFYPFTSNVYQEVLPSARQGYPYPIKALFLHKGTPGLSVPAAQGQLNVLADTEKLPLFFACDIVIGESSMYADYLFPDLSIWERFGLPHATPDVNTKTSKVRQPIVAPMTETVTVFGEKMPVAMETVMLAIAEKLNLPGYGANGLGEGWPLARMEDFYLKMVANIAMGDKANEAVPAANLAEMKLFLKARQHLPKTIFDAARWEKAVGSDKWKHVVYVLNRGGRYEDFDKAYQGRYLKHRVGGVFSLYVEPVALTKHSMTGRPFSGMAIYDPVRDARGNPVQQNGYAFQLITYKDILGGQSRTLPTDYWLSAIVPENYVLMNSKDADRLGVSDDDRVRVVSASNPEGKWDLKNGRELDIAGKVKVIEGLRPGTLAISWHFGHWAYGANDVKVDGQTIKGDARRGRGLCPNAVLLADPYLKDVCLTDPIGGSASYYDTRVNLVKIA
ncbi:MAG: molybdopterin oxidoreductase [Calditrichaeota bacterium]|nr:MAG: molybdopterin oxidoreductase [Calditrichota bacterium]